jgi:hypothetical protein
MLIPTSTEVQVPFQHMLETPWNFSTSATAKAKQKPRVKINIDLAKLMQESGRAHPQKTTPSVQ